MQLDLQALELIGECGTLPVAEDDEVTRRFAMLIEGECDELSRLEAARKYGYTRQRYAQLLDTYRQQESAALCGKPRGPNRNYRRGDELVRRIVRHRFLEPAASAEVIAQKLRQMGFLISTRSVERTIADYGLQKKPIPEGV